VGVDRERGVELRAVVGRLPDERGDEQEVKEEHERDRRGEVAAQAGAVRQRERRDRGPLGRFAVRTGAARPGAAQSAASRRGVGFLARTEGRHGTRDVDRRQEVDETDPRERRDEYRQLPGEPDLNRREQRVVPREADEDEPPGLVAARDRPRRGREDRDREVEPEPELEQRPEHHREVRREQRCRLGDPLAEEQVVGARPKSVDVSRAQLRVRDEPADRDDRLGRDERERRQRDPAPQLAQPDDDERAARDEDGRDPGDRLVPAQREVRAERPCGADGESGEQRRVGVRRREVAPDVEGDPEPDGGRGWDERKRRAAPGVRGRGHGDGERERDEPRLRVACVRPGSRLRVGMLDPSRDVDPERGQRRDEEPEPQVLVGLVVEEADGGVHDVHGREPVEQHRGERGADVAGEQARRPVDEVSQTDGRDDREPRGDRGRGVDAAEQRRHPPVRRVGERARARGAAHVREQSEIEGAVGAGDEPLLPVAEEVGVVARGDDEPPLEHRGRGHEARAGDREQRADEAEERDCVDVGRGVEPRRSGVGSVRAPGRVGIRPLWTRVVRVGRSRLDRGADRVRVPESVPVVDLAGEVAGDQLAEPAGVEVDVGERPRLVAGVALDEGREGVLGLGVVGEELARGRGRLLRRGHWLSPVGGAD